MRTLKILFTLMLFSLISNTYMQAKNEINSETTYGMYKLGSSEQANSVRLEKENTYTIYYENYDTPVTVTVYETKKCKNFVVKAKNFEVQYTCNGKYFGVKYLDEMYASIPADQMINKINRAEFLNQRCITQNIRSDKEFVHLIACFLPEIMIS